MHTHMLRWFLADAGAISIQGLILINCQTYLQVSLTIALHRSPWAASDSCVLIVACVPFSPGLGLLDWFVCVACCIRQILPVTFAQRLN